MLCAPGKNRFDLLRTMREAAGDVISPQSTCIPDKGYWAGICRKRPFEKFVTYINEAFMKILVTGATGFVGTALINRLGREGFMVRAAVLAGEKTDHLPASAEKIMAPPLPDMTGYAELLRGTDAVVHLAARVHIMQDGAADPLTEFRKVNVTGTERLARLAAATGVRRMVFLSSVKVHGEGRAAPYTETDPLFPIDHYGVSKQEAEDALRRVAAETGLEVVIIRPPLVYGPGVKANFLKLLKTVRMGIPLPFGCIRNRRSLIGLGNLVDAVLACACHPKATGNTYLVSDGEDVSTPELARRIASALGCPARVVPVPMAIMHLAGMLTGKRAEVARLAGSLTVDTGKIRRDLGWRPPFTMEQGLAETADWLSKQNSTSNP